MILTFHEGACIRAHVCAREWIGAGEGGRGTGGVKTRVGGRQGKAWEPTQLKKGAGKEKARDGKKGPGRRSVPVATDDRLQDATSRELLRRLALLDEEQRRRILMVFKTALGG